MNENRYLPAGILAIVQTVLFPLGFIVGILIGTVNFGRHADVVPFNISDLIFLVNTAISVYVLTMFRKFLNDRFEYSGIGILINITIVWVIVFEISGLAIREYFLMNPWFDDRIYAVTNGFYIAFSMVFIGVIDILIGIKLLKAKESLNDLLAVFAYISLIAGICEVTVILSFISLFMLPVSTALLAAILLRRKEELQFV